MNDVNNNNPEFVKDIARSFFFLAIFFVIATTIPIIGFFATIFFPLPIIFYSLKNGKNFGMLVFFMGLVLITFFYGSSFDTLFFLSFILIGYFLSELLKRNLSIEKTIILTTTSSLLIVVLILVVYSNLNHTSIKELFTTYIANILNLFFEQYSKMETNGQHLTIIQNYIDIFKYFFLYLSPSFATISFATISITEFLLIRWMLNKKKLFFPDFGELKNWKTHHILVWGIIASIVLTMFFKTKVSIFALNATIIFSFIYFLQGIAIIAFYFDKKKVPLFFRFFIYSVILIQQFLILAIAIFGIFDVWFNFRKIETRPLNN